MRTGFRKPDCQFNGYFVMQFTAAFKNKFMWLAAAFKNPLLTTLACALSVAYGGFQKPIFDNISSFLNPFVFLEVQRKSLSL
jgi:hypothetical protein